MMVMVNNAGRIFMWWNAAAQIQTCKLMHILTRTHTHMHTHACTLQAGMHAGMQAGMHACTRTHAGTHTHPGMHKQACMQTHPHVVLSKSIAMQYLKIFNEKLNVLTYKHKYKPIKIIYQ